MCDAQWKAGDNAAVAPAISIAAGITAIHTVRRMQIICGESTSIIFSGRPVRRIFLSVEMSLRLGKPVIRNMMVVLARVQNNGWKVPVMDGIREVLCLQA